MVTEEVEHTLQEKLKPKSIILCGIEVFYTKKKEKIQLL